MGTRDKRSFRFRHWRRTSTRAAEGNYRRLFREFPVGLFRSSREGNIQEANPALARMLGYPNSNSLLRQNAIKLYRNPSDRENLLKELDQKGVAEVQSFALIRADGSTLWVDEYVRAVKNRKGEIIAYEGCIIDSTRRNEIEAALRETELKYRTLIEQLPNAVIYMDSVDPQIATFYISPQIEKLLGYSPEEWARNPRLWPERIHPEDRDRIVAMYLAHQKTGEPFSAEYRLITRTGEPVWIQDQAAMLFDETGRPKFSHGLMIDITARKAAESGLARQMAQLNAIYKVSQEMVTSQEIERVYEASHEAARQLMPVDAFCISLIDEARQEAEDVYLFDRGKRWPNERGPLSQRGLLLRVMESSEPILIADDTDGSTQTMGSYYFGNPDDEQETRSILLVPLIINGKAMGMMSAQNYLPNIYTSEDAQALATLGNQVAIAIEHTRLLQSYRLRMAALNATANAIVITNEQGEIEWANPAFTRLTGYTLEDVSGKNPGVFLKSGKQDTAFYSHMWNTILAGKVWQGELINRRKDGTLYSEEMTITPLPEGRPGGNHFIAVKRDITERQLAENALRESEEKYRTVVEQADDGICIIQRGVIRYINPRLAEMRGEPAARLIGTHFYQHINASDRRWILDLYRRRMAGQEIPSGYEIALPRKDNSPLYVEMSAAQITYLGAPAELVLLRDISQRKLAEQIMQRQLNEMVALNEVSAAGVRITDIDELIRSVTYTIRNYLYPDNCGVLLLNEDGCTWTPHASYQGFPAEGRITKYKLSEGVAGKVISNGTAARIEHTEQEPAYIETTPGMQAELCIPMSANGKVFGCLNAESRTPEAFTEHDERLLTTIADSLSIAIDKINLLKMERQRRAEAAAITEVGRDISASLELGIVLDRIAAYAKDLLAAETSAVYLGEAGRSTLRAVAAIGVDSTELKNDPLSVGRGILGNIARKKTGEIVNEPDLDPRGITVKGTQALNEEHIMGVPVLAKDELIGLIAVWRTGAGLEFKPTELDFLNSLAQQVAMAIENARLFEETQKRLREMDSLVQVGAALSHTLELEPLLEEILQAAVQAIPGSERGSILLADEDDNLQIRATWGYSDPRIHGFRFAPDSGYSTKAFREQRAIVINDIHNNPETFYTGEIVEMFDRGSAMAAPLIVKGKPIGVIAIDTPHAVDAFEDRDLNLLTAIASSAGLAIENARLFESTRQRLSEIQAVHTVSASLRSAQTIDQALPIILEQLMEILSAGAASLDMVDTVSGEIVTILARGAWIGVTGLRTPPGAGISGHVMATGQPYVTTDVVADGKVARPDLFAGMRSVACVPIMAQHLPIGTLWVGRVSPITEEECSLLSAIGEMVGNALHRMRLNAQTERRADQLTSLRTIDQAISASLDLRLTLNILLEQVLGHLKVNAADILLLDGTTGLLEPAASRGFRTPSIGRFQQQLSESLGNRVARERHLLQIPDLPDYVDKFKGSLLLKDEEFYAYYGIPLLAKEQLVGVLECFHRSQLNVDSEWIEFFEALAGQAAIAIEKARLLDDLQTSNQELTRAYDTTLEGWARALELRDKETEGHSRRVTELTMELARQFGISGPELVHIRRGVLLHDIGKMGVSDHILKKPGPLNEDELAEMHNHAQYAYDLIYPITYLRPTLDIPYSHHEKWDGTGYPDRLSGTDIPLSARIFSVVDVWDALSHDRPYRKAWTQAEVLAYIRDQSGKHFDPEVVEKFLSLVSVNR